MKTVRIAVNEVIVCVVAKLRDGNQSVYSDFQFQIAKLESPLNLNNIYSVSKIRKKRDIGKYRYKF